MAAGDGEPPCGKTSTGSIYSRPHQECFVFCFLAGVANIPWLNVLRGMHRRRVGKADDDLAALKVSRRRRGACGKGGTRPATVDGMLSRHRRTGDVQREMDKSPRAWSNGGVVVVASRRLQLLPHSEVPVGMLVQLLLLMLPQAERRQGLGLVALSISRDACAQSEGRGGFSRGYRVE